MRVPIPAFVLLFLLLLLALTWALLLTHLVLAIRVNRANLRQLRGQGSESEQDE